MCSMGWGVLHHLLFCFLRKKEWVPKGSSESPGIGDREGWLDPHRQSPHISLICSITLLHKCCILLRVTYQMSLRPVTATQWEPVSNIYKIALLGTKTNLPHWMMQHFAVLLSLFTVHFSPCFSLPSYLFFQESTSCAVLASFLGGGKEGKEVTNHLMSRRSYQWACWETPKTESSNFSSQISVSVLLEMRIISEMSAAMIPNASMCMLETKTTSPDLHQEGETGMYLMQ